MMSYGGEVDGGREGPAPLTVQLLIYPVRNWW